MGKREGVGRIRARVKVRDRGSAVRMVAMISDCELVVVETGLRVVGWWIDVW